MKKPEEEEFGASPDAYKPASWRGALLMFIVAAVGIALVWYAWASSVRPGS